MISIIILNWNAKKMTEECLNSLMSQLNKNFEVLVVDNGSSDCSSKYLKKKFPKIKIIESKENLGYTGGNNLGVKNSKGNYFLILNNDIVVDKNFLKEVWKHKDDADILGVKSYYYDKRDILWAIGSKVNKFTMRANLVGNKVKDNGQLDDFRVEQVVGVSMLINKRVIDKVGFLDEGYFAYFEETEWQTRAKDAGFLISWIPSAKIWHKVGFSTGGERSPTSAYYLVRNRAYYIKKWGKCKIISYPYWFVEIIARLIYGMIKNPKHSRMTWRGMIDFFIGERGKLE